MHVHWHCTSGLGASCRTQLQATDAMQAVLLGGYGRCLCSGMLSGGAPLCSAAHLVLASCRTQLQLEAATLPVVLLALPCCCSWTNNCWCCRFDLQLAQVQCVFVCKVLESASSTNCWCLTSTAAAAVLLVCAAGAGAVCIRMQDAGVQQLQQAAQRRARVQPHAAKCGGQRQPPVWAHS